MKSRTPESYREEYTTARRDAHKFERQSKKDAWNTLCEEMAKDVIGIKKLIYQLAKSYRKCQQQRLFTIKMKYSDEIITEQYKKRLRNAGQIISRIYLMLTRKEMMK